MAPLLLSSESPHYPGRFPSPTPSPESYTLESSRNTPHSPGASIHQNYDRNNPSSDFTASMSMRQRPLFSETRSDTPLPRERSSDRQQYDFPATPLSPSPRPRLSFGKRVVSDIRHDRIRDRLIHSHGSPVRRARRRIQQLAHSPRNGAVDVPQQHQQEIQDNIASERRDLELPALEATVIAPSPISPKTAQQVHAELRTRLYKDLTPNNRKGVVYIVQNSNTPHLLKIGATMNPRQRFQQLERTCGLKLKVVYISTELDDYARAESLSQGDLWNLCRPYWCFRCAQEHREWHDADEELAIRTVKRWVSFVRDEEPYDSEGKIKGVWQHLLVRRGIASMGDAIMKHNSRWEKWTQILEPPSWEDYCWYHFQVIRSHPIWSFVWEFSWQASSLFSWLITFLFVRNFLVFLIFLCHVICVWLTVSSRSPQGLGLRRAGPK